MVRIPKALVINEGVARGTLMQRYEQRQEQINGTASEEERQEASAKSAEALASVASCDAVVLFLMVERQHVEGSAWGPYLQLLPERPPVLLYENSSRLAGQLQSTESLFRVFESNQQQLQRLDGIKQCRDGVTTLRC